MAALSSRCIIPISNHRVVHGTGASKGDILGAHPLKFSREGNPMVPPLGCPHLNNLHCQQKYFLLTTLGILAGCSCLLTLTWRSTYDPCKVNKFQSQWEDDSA